MATPTQHGKVCPTRIDGGAALFTHRVSQEQCQDRQRGRYHKCYTCAYNNTYVSVHGLPEIEQPEQVAPSNQAAEPEQVGSGDEKEPQTQRLRA